MRTYCYGTHDRPPHYVTDEGISDFLDSIVELLEKASKIADECDAYTEGTIYETSAKSIVDHCISEIQDIYVEEYE